MVLKFYTRVMAAFVLMLAACFGEISAQTASGGGEVSGLIVTDTGEPVIGAAVIEKGTSNGTVTDLDGHFSFTVSDAGSEIVASYVGYKSVSFKAGTGLKIVLVEDSKVLDEVVVTALGITREAKSLGYSVQKVDGLDLTESHESNFINSLSNRIAGVQITNSSGGIGASSSIQIRGQNFVGGYNYNNSPLFVVDGVPISNNNEQSTRSFTGRQDFNNPNFTSGEAEVDYGNAAAEINQEDIESVSVLKGPNAAALYGARAANGVILITTKSGKGQKGFGVTLSSTTSFETALRLPEFQNEFGQGIEGEYAYVDGAGGGINDGTVSNWGPALNGQLIPQFDSPLDANGNRIATPFVSHGNQLADFLQTGYNLSNTVTLSNSNDKLNFRLTYTNNQQKGIVPNTGMQRNTIGLSSGYQITPKLRADVTMNYVHSNSDNRASTGAKNTDNIMTIFLKMPRNVSLASLRQQWRTGMTNIAQNTPVGDETSTGINNPYFVVYNNLNGNVRDRVYGNVRLKYDILPGLSLQIRSGLDFYADKRTMRHAVTSQSFFNGYYQEDDINFIETNNDFLLTYELPADLVKNFGFTVSAGGNLMNQISKRLGAIAPELTIPGVYNLTNNAKPILAGNTLTQKKVNSLYATAQFRFFNGLYVDLTGRNDWSSALPKQNNSYFYPSGSVSAILTDLFDIRSRYLSFAKVRASSSMVRRDLEPYQTASNFVIQQGWGGNSTATANNNYPNPDIRPEKVVSYEFGADVRLFDNRLGIDATYYKSITTDLIIPITLNPSAGYDTKLMNVGKMTNQGVELMVNVTPVKMKDFVWNVNFNFSKNVNKVLALAEDKGISRIRQIERWASLELRTENTKGDGSYGSLYGDYLVYKDGQLQLKNGLPVEENGDWGYLGNVNPDWTGGLGTELKYKNWSLSALFGFQHGGVVYSRTYIEGMRNGSLKETLKWRTSPDGAGMIIADGIDVDTGEKNEVAVPIRNFVQAYYDNDMIATFDASYVKLRELKISYSFPKRWLEKTPLKNVSLSAFGRNLFLWTKVPNIDPEVASYDGQLKGIETMSLPSMRSMGFNINVTF